MSKSIVGVNFINDRTGEFSGNVYHYFCEIPVAVGDVVLAPSKNGTSAVRIVEVDVSEDRIEKRILKMLKTISETAGEETDASSTTGDAIDVDMSDVLQEPVQELIVVKQLPVIEERLRSISERVKDKTQEALSLVCTDETVKAIKKVRADLARGFKALEAQRKMVKGQIMSPYEQFEAIYKACVTDVYAPADAELKRRIDEVETTLKNQKGSEVEAYFKEYAQSRGIDFLSFTQSNINATISSSLKSLKTSAKDFIDRVADDLAMIEMQENREEILVEYKKTLNASTAMTTVARRHEAIEAERKRAEEERLAKEQREEAARKATEIAAQEQEAPATPPVVLRPPVINQDAQAEVESDPATKIYKVVFAVHGTLEQLREIKAFLENGGYKYESVK